MEFRCNSKTAYLALKREGMGCVPGITPNAEPKESTRWEEQRTSWQNRALDIEGRNGIGKAVCQP